jgi:hypothetical protein
MSENIEPLRVVEMEGLFWWLGLEDFLISADLGKLRLFLSPISHTSSPSFPLILSQPTFIS